ncbi:polyhydroxyalkanoate synthesis repressor PhaR [Myxococcota bacterium]|nr:polyhydroxyalkanoate synthesis repressor PhaR [Myxococcota bacterium]
MVKKYGNRRLYDTNGSRYITLEELAEIIRAGTDVRVVDAKTGEDLTPATLTQIIIEGRGAGKMLPVPLLMQLIRLDDAALGEFMGRFMSWSLDLYIQARQGAQMIAPMNPFANVPFAATNALARMFNGGGQGFGGLGGLGGAMPWNAQPPPAQPAPAAAPQGAEATASAEDLASLKRELDELKAALGGMAKKKRG